MIKKRNPPTWRRPPYRSFLFLAVALLTFPKGEPAASPVQTSDSILELKTEMNLFRQRLMNANTEFAASGKPRSAFDLTAICAPFRESLDTRLQAIKEPARRRALLLARFRVALLLQKHAEKIVFETSQEPSAELMAAIAAEVPDTDPAWGVDPELFTAYLVRTVNPREWEARYEAGVRNPDPDVRLAVLCGALQMLPQVTDGEEAKSIVREKWLARLVAAFPDRAETWEIQEQFQNLTKSATQPKMARLPLANKPCPTFRLADLADSTFFYTPEIFRGNWLLLDLWATWCGPCRNEVPFLQKAWERFQNRGLEILSISFDREASQVVSFRQKRAAMPWKHAFPDSQARADLCRALFGNEGYLLPTMILVNPAGLVVATEGLEGEALEKTIEKALGE